MRQTLEDGMRFLGGMTTRPRLLLLHLVLELVEDLLDVPTLFVAQCNRPGWKLEFIGEVGVFLAVARILIGDATQCAGAVGSYEDVAKDAVVARITPVGGVHGDRLESAVALFASDKVNAPLLEAEPGFVVDAGLVPKVDCLLAGWDLIAQVFDRRSLNDEGVVVFLFSVLGPAEIKIAEVVAAEVDPEEMSGGNFLRSFASLPGSVKTGRLLIVTVGGEEVISLQFGEGGERVCDDFGHHGSEGIVGRAQVGEAPFALERFEEEVRVFVPPPSLSVFLQELVPGLGVSQAAQRAKDGVIQITENPAIILTQGIRVDGFKRGEEPAGDVCL